MTNPKIWHRIYDVYQKCADVLVFIIMHRLGKYKYSTHLCDAETDLEESLQLFVIFPKNAQFINWHH